MCEISVIMPAYNAEKSITESIESVLNQTYQDFELIIINDGSKDNTLEICKRFTKAYSNIKLINQKNKGVSAARNCGIKNADGKYIMFIDSDDTYNSRIIELMYNKIKESDYDCVMCDIKYINKQDEKELGCFSKNKDIYNKDDLLSELYPFIDVNGFHTLYNKIYVNKIIKENGIEFDDKLSMAEDLLFNLIYIDKCNSCAFVHKALYNYNIENSFLSNKYRSDEFEKRIIVIKNLKQFYQKNNLSETVVYWQYIKISYAAFMMMCHKKCDMSLTEKLNNINKIISQPEITYAVNNVEPCGIIQKIITNNIKTHSPLMIYLFSKIMNKVHKKIRKRK